MDNTDGSWDASVGMGVNVRGSGAVVVAERLYYSDYLLWLGCHDWYPWHRGGRQERDAYWRSEDGPLEGLYVCIYQTGPIPHQQHRERLMEPASIFIAYNTNSLNPPHR